MDYNFFSFGMSGDRQAKCPFPPGSKTMRKLFVLLWIFTFLAAPSHASTKVTVQQLSTMLDELHQQGKPDEAVATKLKELELTEQLSLATMNSFTRDQPGPLTTTQIRILGVESALLPPPPSDLPSDAAPDRPAQAAIMSRALDYAAKQYAQLPKLSADKQTIRFQNGVTGVHTNSGTFSNFASGDPGMNAVNPYLLMLGVHTAPVESEHGIELPQPVEKQKNPASQNGQISQGGAGLVLGVILVDAAKGNLSWLRWEMVDGKKTAVFSFAVPKKQSHYKVNYCCFPVIENIGGAGAVNQGTSMPSIMAQPGGTATSFKSFKADPGYHGELFIDPETGTIVRLITKADLKPTDLVQQEDIRVDYGPVEVGDKSYVVPVHSMILTQVAPNGDALVKYSTRRTLFDVTYQNYKLGETNSAKN
jgi:hypothetical protein